MVVSVLQFFTRLQHGVFKYYKKQALECSQINLIFDELKIFEML